MNSRTASYASQLRRAGVRDPARAEKFIDEISAACGVEYEAAPEALARAADPDAALLGLSRLTDAMVADGDVTDLVALLDTGGGARLLAVLGGSTALTDFIVTHPALVKDFGARSPGTTATAEDVRAQLLTAVGADPAAEVPVADVLGNEGINAMRVAYRRHLLRIAAEDLTSDSPTELQPLVARGLADLAGAALEAGLALARAEHPDYAQTRLCIIGMGKCGGRELNYVSDVDVVYVAEPGVNAAGEPATEAESVKVATALANYAARACDKTSTEQALWPVDANLRPEGKDGVLVRNVASHQAYYERWASTWEFQALLKSRPIAGDLAVGEAYCEAMHPMVWQASQRDNFVEDAQAMRRRVEDHVPKAEEGRQLKLGPGGLRDVEFTIQLLQLVHGREDDGIRSSTTLEALEQLRNAGYVGRTNAARMEQSYRQLRVWEHRLQMSRMMRTHLMPSDEDALRTLARSSGFASADALAEAWQTIRVDVRHMHLEMFYRPMLGEVARLGSGEAQLGTGAARARLAAVGFVDPEGAQRHIAALTDGVSRRASIQRQILPAMIGWFARGADPDAGLLAFRKLSEQLADSQWYLKLLRDSRTAAQRLAKLLSTSGYVTDALLASGESVTWLDDDKDLVPMTRERLMSEADAILTRSDDWEQAITAIRGLRRRELARTAAANVLGLVDAVKAAQTVTDIADMAIEGALRIAVGDRAMELGLEALPVRMAIVAMGRYGGEEMGYTSDADVMFVYEPIEGAEGADSADAHAQVIAARVRDLLQRANAQPPLEIDADLRPEGKNGPLARSFESFTEYYSRWSDPWEAQALLRARPCAGDPSLVERFAEMMTPIRYPAVLTPSAVTQMRTLKARMESERLPRGADPLRHLKLGPGGLADVEWTIQLLQLRHAHELAPLRTTQTLDALVAAVQAKLINDNDARTLRNAWVLASQLRGAIALRGKKVKIADLIPGEARELKVLAGILALDLTWAELDDLYVRTSRRARAVVERVFYGWEQDQQ